MNCAEFMAWLDSGARAPDLPAATHHTAGCAGCARRLATAHRIDELLATPLPHARTGLAQQIMLRVHESSAPGQQPGAQVLAASASRWQPLLAEPAVLFPALAAGLGILFALVVVFPGTARLFQPGIDTLRQLAWDGARCVSGMTPDLPVVTLSLLGCAALAGAAWFATQGPGFRSR